ncbi:hypothetical protein K505DRAFT_45425 [Melanomma pulvis-pyrius CBS 109.77]|uniref:Uncharacterized protein n=1 Tax=Melanomma pulvis-pyrius CBS 109.77 TaxID=1314802 RepID=A0A6A6X9S0_9PLEO|nr:hypothetical protein K505DRAFT_45425 [Melanomma pulvis-pyrius CBS 109.77]
MENERECEAASLFQDDGSERDTVLLCSGASRNSASLSSGLHRGDRPGSRHKTPPCARAVTLRPAFQSSCVLLPAQTLAAHCEQPLSPLLCAAACWWRCRESRMCASEGVPRAAGIPVVATPGGAPPAAKGRSEIYIYSPELGTGSRVTCV